jgi:hypothetical protein
MISIVITKTVPARRCRVPPFEALRAIIPANNASVPQLMCSAKAAIVGAETAGGDEARGPNVLSLRETRSDLED